MHAILTDDGTCFVFDLCAETTEEAALLLRFGINRTASLIQADASAYSDNTVRACIVIGKRKRSESTVARARKD